MMTEHSMSKTENKNNNNDDDSNSSSSSSSSSSTNARIEQLAALRKRSKLSVTSADAVAITDVPVQPAGLAILNTHNITDFGIVPSTQTRR